MIYPIPQKNNLNGESITVKSVTVSGDCKNIAENVFRSYGIGTEGGFKVEIEIADSRKTTYIEETSSLTDEKYFINVNNDGALIETSSERGVFRALNTLCKFIEKDELKAGELEDYPLFDTRGYIEGFYGKTWEEEKRHSVMSLMAKYGMNTYYYAPKDDIYHREKWRELYPEKELNDLKNLFDFATDSQMDFFWCVGPGLSYKYTSEEDFNLLIEKIKSIYALGIRNFGLLLDDIPTEFCYEEDKAAFDGIVDAHIQLINKTYNALKKFDDTISLTVCPTQYSGDEKGYYISKFGRNIPSDVKMFWTGAEICSRILTVRESEELLRSTGHNPLFWDNYPVNDCEMYQEMHLGAIIGRDKDLYKCSEGLIANVMEYAECSKIPLMTIADYLWNPHCYCPEKSLENAYEEIFGEKGEIFKYFGDNLGVSCLSRYSGGIMSSTLGRIRKILADGNRAAAVGEFREYIGKMRKCLDLLENDEFPIFAELVKWTKKFSMCCDLLDAICNEWENPTEENFAILKDLTEKYNSDGTILTGFAIRETAEKTLGLY